MKYLYVSALTTQISFSSVDYTVESEDVQSPDQVSVIAVPVKAAKPSDVEYCIALYDYDASAEDELTFEENQIITIVNKSPHGVDDGWWEGRHATCTRTHNAHREVTQPIHIAFAHFR